jgi:hypothetical protein
MSLSGASLIICIYKRNFVGFGFFKSIALGWRHFLFYPVLHNYHLKVILTLENQMDLSLKSRAKIIWKMMTFYNAEL